VIGDLEQGVLGGPPDLIEPFGRHAITEERIVGDPGEQRRLGFGCRLGKSQCGDMFNPLGKFYQLSRTRRRMAFDPASLGPRIGGVMVPDIAEQ